MTTINLFNHIVFHLKEWYIQKLGITTQEFNENNDLNILKIIKLHFFVVAINSKQNDILLLQNNFCAMPYGPVETLIYSSYKRSQDFELFSLTKEQTIFKDIPLTEIEIDFSNAIIESIEILKKLEPELILADAGSLVELTHTWNSWKKNYKLALSNNKFSYPIPKDEIKNDIKIVNLNFIN